MVKGFPFLVLVLVSEFRFSFRKTCDLCSKRVECFFFCKVESLYVFFVSFLCLLWSFLAFFGLLWSFLVFFARTLSFYNTGGGGGGGGVGGGKTFRTGEAFLEKVVL